MNFLAHHAVALARAARAGDDNNAPEFYVGNVLPDLIAMSGDPRVRPAYLAGIVSPLTAGMALHFESDRRFHALPAFSETQIIVKSLLVSAPFPEPPGRIFFLAHVFVEIALDSHILRETPKIAHDFYECFERADLQGVVAEVQTLLGNEKPLTALTNVLARFARSRYLFEYADSEGCADALHEICRRAGVAGFSTPESRVTLAGIFDTFKPLLVKYAPLLLEDNWRAQSMVQ